MVVSWTKGRLGNLMFEILVGKYYADQNGQEFALLNNNEYDGYLNNLSKTALKGVNIVNNLRGQFQRLENRDYPFRKYPNVYMYGYLENPKFWGNDREYAKKIFAPPSRIIEKIKEIYSDINFEEMVSINVRRGDYLTNDVNSRLGLLKTEYFKECISKFPQNQKFFITSDDISYCKHIFKGDNFIFGDRNSGGEEKIFIDLYLQTLCKDNIISNSTFSWWGAYLNIHKDRKVYHPYPFFRIIRDRDRIPTNDNWIEVKAIFESLDYKQEIIRDMEDVNIIKERVLEKEKKHGININIDNPVTIIDKLNWLKIYDSTPLKTRCADKYLLGEYCEEILGVNLCVPKIFVYNNISEIKWEELPQQFAIKCNHGSSMNIIVKDKNRVNKKDILSKLDEWMQIDYSNYYEEMYYQDIKHKILVEPLLQDEPNDTKMWCFNGKMKFCSREVPLINKIINHYDRNYNFIEIGFNHIRPDKNVHYEKPKYFEQMIEYAEKLSANFKFCRVDFMESDGKLYLGEITFIPWAGTFRFMDEKDNYKLGNMLDLGIEKKHNKKCIYTSIIGGYDDLMIPKFINNDFDYICYTDTNIKSDFWQIRPLPKETEGLSNIKKQRYIKMLPHKLLPEYETSVYVDGNIEILGDVNEIIDEYMDKNNTSIYIPKHYQRDCIYVECNECIKQNKDTYENIYPQFEQYKKEGFPKHYGLTQNCIMFRFHNETDCIKLMEEWWKEYLKQKSCRDQLSLYYVLWKNKGIKIQQLDEQLHNSKYFRRLQHKNK